jgi:integrase
MEAIPDPAFKTFVRFLRLTGARVHDARILTADMIHPEAGVAIIPATLAKGGKRPCPIHLSPKALDLVRPLMEAHPAGPLFRDNQGNPWKVHTLCRKMKALAKKLGIKGTLRTLRAVFATDALIAEVNPIAVQNLLGHVNGTMVASVYQRLARRVDHLQKALDKGTAGIE